MLYNDVLLKFIFNNNNNNNNYYYYYYYYLNNNYKAKCVLGLHESTVCVVVYLYIHIFSLIIKYYFAFLLFFL